MSEEGRGFLGQVLWCLVSPRKAFESIHTGDLWKGLVLVLILTSASALAGYSYASKLPLVLPEVSRSRGFMHARPAFDPEVFRRNFMTFYALRDGLRAVSGWLIPSVLLHLFASLLGGRGSLKRTLALNGFASIPLVFQQILRVVDAYTISGEELLGIASARLLGQTLAMRLASNLLAVFTVFGIWAFALIVLAASINYEVLKGRAAIATILAYLVFAVVRVFLPV